MMAAMGLSQEKMRGRNERKNTINRVHVAVVSQVLRADDIMAHL